MSTPPIPVPDPNSEYRLFYIAFTRFFLTSSLAGLLCLVPFIIYIELPNRPLREILSIVAFSSFVGIIAGALYSAAIVYLLPIRMNKSALRSANAWGLPASVRLMEISSVKRINFLTLPYLKVSTHKKKNALWLPLYLTDLPGFRAAVTQYTPPDNPLHIALES